MNTRVPDLTMNLGDLIIDSHGLPAIQHVTSIWNQIEGERHYVLGNHEADPSFHFEWFDPQNHYAPANWLEPLFSCDLLTPISDCRRWYSIYIGDPPRVAVMVVSNNSDELFGDVFTYPHCTTPNDSLNHAGSTQRIWLNTEIDALPPSIDVVFVLGHRTYYGVEGYEMRPNILFSGVGDGYPGTAPAETLRTGAVSFLRDLESIHTRKPNVQLVIMASGDQHCFAEVERLRVNTQDDEQGIKYLVLGISGARNDRSAVYPDLTKIPPGTLVHAFDDRWGYSRFEVTRVGVDFLIHEAYSDTLLYQTSWSFDVVSTDATVGGETRGPPGANIRVWPNPANETVSIHCVLHRHAPIDDFGVYDVTGRRVKNLCHGSWERGVYSRLWDLRDDRGRPVAAGTYFVRARYAGGTIAEKVVVTR
jgi:hypothetical protein